MESRDRATGNRDPVFVVAQRRMHCIDGASGAVRWTHQFGVAMSPDASTDVCRWHGMIVVAFDAHVIFVRETDGEGVRVVRLPAPFQPDVPLRIMARPDRILAYGPAAVAALSSAGEIAWVTAYSESPGGRMPAIVWRDVCRSGLHLTFDRRIR